MLTACLPVYTGSGKTVNFSHGGGKWKNQKRQGAAAWETASKGLLAARQKAGSGGRTISVPGPTEEDIHTALCLQKDTLSPRLWACLSRSSVCFPSSVSICVRTCRVSPSSMNHPDVALTLQSLQEILQDSVALFLLLPPGILSPRQRDSPPWLHIESTWGRA